MQAHIKQRIESTINNIAALPTMPEVATKILNMVNDPEVSFKAVAEELAKDQSMTTNVLKLCNSAYFSKGKEITSIERAIVTLGIKELTNIVMVIAAKPILDKYVIGYDLGKGELWKQGLLVGILSKQIALLKNRKDIADVVFTGGIIHNVGKTVIAIFVQNTYNDILEEVRKNNITFTEAEKNVMGYSHQEISEKILEKWNFPAVLRAIVRYYAEPENAPAEFKTEVSIVHIAHSIGIMAGIGIGSDGLYHQLSKLAIDNLKMDNQELEELFTKIPEITKQAMAIG
ncbi:MAG TPA: HDOD domain-containing protein [Spirochaetota bacterium]|jgi:HD-like signal output (HDOD) protein|nr:HDOD domain-containing protein [Spirochaetota bacterium]OQA97574.1 MAG: HDOD domain protein [Spirochaetes bacterium ADurb.Bin218]HOK02829.1 HDOD domain-containing protein [Spirochaetota bacterium]HOK93000.1 HDOD domain-containing protein [Spirochaetota bacterium]HON15457.1 HDOD domain-containing protein [Spirochaetota bacterium]